MFTKIFKTRKDYVKFRRVAKHRIEKLSLNRVRFNGKKRLKLTYFEV
ncbi:hypothetical protein ACQUY5_23715 [Bacillus cereus]